MRLCAKCRQSKPIEQFPRNRYEASGRHHYCGPCKRASNRASYRRHAERIKLAQRLARYGLSADDYQQLLSKQDHRCAACCLPFASSRATHIDHDHQTTRIRGVLCHHCNTALGLVRHDAKRLEQLITYLKEAV